MGARGSERRMPPSRGLRLLRAVGSALGAIVGFVTALVVVTTAEGVLARARLLPTRDESLPVRTGRFGDDERPPIAFGMMGDSLAVGYGSEDPDSTPGVLLAKGLVEASGRSVVLTNVADIGAESVALVPQLAKLRTAGVPDVVVIVIGANDVMHLKRLTDALWPLSAVVGKLRHDGTRVVVATCPDLGTIHPFTQPLRFFAHWYSRVLATGQAIVVLRAGGRSVSLADTLGPLFRREPEDMFSAHDRLHPSDLGYAAAAAVILPSLRVAAGYPLPVDVHLPHRVYRKGSHHPLAWWAFRASRRVGSRLAADAGDERPVPDR